VKLVRFDPSHPITHFDSTGATIGGMARCSGSTRISILELGPGGVVGMHEAASPQLFLVVAGDGRVRSGDAEARPIAAGEAAFWERGEPHETTTDGGVTAVVVEADSIELL
jgi:quercetin dioxygenase-like cupin family protein